MLFVFLFINFNLYIRYSAFIYIDSKCLDGQSCDCFILQYVLFVYTRVSWLQTLMETVQMFTICSNSEHARLRDVTNTYYAELA